MGRSNFGFTFEKDRGFLVVLQTEGSTAIYFTSKKINLNLRQLQFARVLTTILWLNNPPS